MPLPVSYKVDIRQKSKMAVAKMKRTDFTAIWLKEDNFKYQCAILSVHVLNEKQATTYGTCQRPITNMVSRHD